MRSVSLRRGEERARILKFPGTSIAQSPCTARHQEGTNTVCSVELLLDRLSRRSTLYFSISRDGSVIQPASSVSANSVPLLLTFPQPGPPAFGAACQFGPLAPVSGQILAVHCRSVSRRSITSLGTCPPHFTREPQQRFRSFFHSSFDILSRKLGWGDEHPSRSNPPCGQASRHVSGVGTTKK